MPTFDFKVQGLTLFLVSCEKVSGFATGRVMRSCAGGSRDLFVPNAFPAEAAFPLWDDFLVVDVVRYFTAQGPEH